MSKQATLDEHLQMHTFATSGLKPTEIDEKMGITEGGVYYIMKSPVTPQKRKVQSDIFDSPRRRQLIDFFIKSPVHWHLECVRTICTVLGTAGLHSRVSGGNHKLPLQTAENSFLLHTATSLKRWKTDNLFSGLMNRQRNV
jgi:hypothetical protein